MRRRSPLIGLTKGADILDRDRRARCRNDEDPILLDEPIAGDGLDPDSDTVELEIHLRWAKQTSALTECPWDDKAASGVDGGSHGKDSTI